MIHGVRRSAAMPRSSVYCATVCGFLLSAPVALAQKTPDQRLNELSPPGERSAWEPRIASSGSAVYVVWEDTHDGGGGQSSPRDVHFDRSLDGGATWLPAEIRLDTRLPAGQNFATGVSLAASDDAVYAAFADNPFGYGLGYDEGIYVNRSLDQGTTWLPSEVRVDHPPATFQCGADSPVIAASGSRVYVAWLDDRVVKTCLPLSSPESVFFNRSLDGGLTWVPFDLRLDFSKPPLTARSSSPALAATGTAIHGVWIDGRNGVDDVFFNRSLDSATTWFSASVRLDSGSTLSVDPRIAAEGSTVCVVWIEYDPSPSQVSNLLFDRSLDGGSTWLAAPVPLATGLSSAIEPTLALEGSTVYVAFEGGVTAPPRDVYFNRSLDAGTTWLPLPVRLDTGPAGTPSREPVLAAEGSSVLVAWSDSRSGGGRDLFCNRSIDSGTTWLAADVRLDVGSAAGVGLVSEPGVAASAASFYAVWLDGRHGATQSNDIYFNLALGQQPYGSGTLGTGGAVPRASASGKASIGGALSIDVSNARGGAVCAFVYTFAGRAAIPSIYGTLLLQPPWASRAVVLGGVAGAAGAGLASVVESVPNDPALVGLRVDFQAGVFDPAATAGVALSNGVEVWIL
jgi:hypothetical protein